MTKWPPALPLVSTVHAMLTLVHTVSIIMLPFSRQQHIFMTNVLYKICQVWFTDDVITVVVCVALHAASGVPVLCDDIL